MRSKQGGGAARLLGRIGVGLVVLGALAGVPGPAVAAEKVDEFRIPFEEVVSGVDNPCTPMFDDIVLDVTGEIVGKTWMDDDGSWRSQAAVHVRESGYAADGTHYVGGNQFRAQTRYDAGIVDIVADRRVRLTSAGADDNFTARFKVLATFDVSGSFSMSEIVKDQAECRG